MGFGPKQSIPKRAGAQSLTLFFYFLYSIFEEIMDLYEILSFNGSIFNHYCTIAIG